MQKIIWALAVTLCVTSAYAQEDNTIEDSLYIHEIQEAAGREKVLHAEPLYIDLIRDLGARKGEKEWNIGAGITDNLQYDTYQTLIEYEFAPWDRIGLEIELPFTFYAPLKGTGKEQMPDSRMESIKTAAQWTFLVSQKYSTSMALGYINELELAGFGQRTQLFTGNTFNPFFIAAKRWGTNFHTLVYTGPSFSKHFHNPDWHRQFDINSNIHYMIPGTRNFVGMEVNKVIGDHDFDMTLRPQLRVSIADNLLIGIVAGIPIKRETERFSSFARIIWEPGARH